MAAGVKYQKFIQAIVEKLINFATDDFAFALSNAAPDVVNHQFLSDATEIAPGFGYPAGGKVLQRTSAGQIAGAYKTIFADPVITAAGGAIGPFRYILLVDQTPGGSPTSAAGIRLVGYYDYGSSISLNDGEVFVPDLDQVAGLIQGA